jgi:uncharacterized protein with NRDE domain
MCTVTYIPQPDTADFILTSNRDERTYRPAISPKLYRKGKLTLCYPKDSKAGGTWIATNNLGRLCCLLNGGFVSHEKQSFHTISRGQVLLGLVSSEDNIQDYFHSMDLSKTEPFTIITFNKGYQNEEFFNEFVWDGKVKHYKILDKNIPYIWSSATLYSAKNRNMREQWFNNFMKNIFGRITANEVLAFHSGKHTNDISNNLIMERDEGLKTVSITQVLSINDSFNMKYHDLIGESQHELTI